MAERENPPHALNDVNILMLLQFANIALVKKQKFLENSVSLCGFQGSPALFFNCFHVQIAPYQYSLLLQSVPQHINVSWTRSSHSTLNYAFASIPSEDGVNLKGMRRWKVLDRPLQDKARSRALNVAASDTSSWLCTLSHTFASNKRFHLLQATQVAFE